MNVFKKIRQRGQILLLYALMIPTLFFFVGITFDLSWYYLNVARMQNAADAAVLAGAQTLIEREGTLSDYNYTTFVNGFDGSKVSPSTTRNTFTGDSIAKDYVMKNIAGDNSFWASDTLQDVFTQRDLRFTGRLLGDSNNNYDVLYYHIMLEEDVPHMMLGKFFPDMKAKVSSVAKITQFMKGYDLYQQMKLLGDKQTYSSWYDIYKQKNYSDNAADARSVILSSNSDLEDYHYTETADLPYNSKYLFDNLLVGTDPAAPQASNYSIDDWAYRTYREININTVYAVRDAAFYSDAVVLAKARAENVDYANLTDEELIQVLAKNSYDPLSKDSYDPLYVRIESEPAGKPVRQVIINVNVDNTSDNARPIILFYDGPVDDESLPVIFNLNAGFKGILFAPISPVVINGNKHKLQGFVIAGSYVLLTTGENYTKGDDDKFYDSDGTLIEKIDNYAAHKCDTHNSYHNNVMYIDELGEVQYKKIGGSYETVDKWSLNSTYNLAETQFDSFNQIWLEYNTVSTDNLFTTADVPK